MWPSLGIGLFGVGLYVVARIWLWLRWRKLWARTWREERQRELRDDSISSEEFWRREMKRNAALSNLFFKRLRGEAVPARFYWPLTIYIVALVAMATSMVAIMLVALSGR